MDNGKERGNKSNNTPRKSVHCECIKPVCNEPKCEDANKRFSQKSINILWKCNNRFWKNIKKSYLFGDFLLFDVSIEPLREFWIAFILFIPLWISLIMLYSNEVISKIIKEQGSNNIPNSVLQFSKTLNFVLNFLIGHFGLILIIVLGFAIILAFILQKLRVVFYLSLYYLVFYMIVLILKDNTYILLSNDKLPAILIGFTTILFTMLIPIGIAILNKLYRKEEEKFGSLDLRTFRVYRLNPAYFIFWLLITFVPLLVFQGNGIDINKITKINVGVLIRQSIVVSVSFIGVFFLALRLIKIYNWSENKKIEYRKRYLNNAGFDKEFIDACKSVWIAEDIDEKEEKEYLCIFTRRIIHSLSCKEKLDITKKLLEDFKENLSNRRNPKNLGFIHDILIEIAKEMKIGGSKTVFNDASSKDAPGIIEAIINHIDNDNYEWANSDKTC